MAGFVEGMSRDQATLFAERLDELASADAAVRAVDAFVDSLDMGALGFTKAVSPFDRSAALRSGRYCEALRLRPSASGAFDPAAGAGMPLQH
jgi:hypothetical protein